MLLLSITGSVCNKLSALAIVTLSMSASILGASSRIQELNNNPADTTTAGINLLNFILFIFFLLNLKSLVSHKKDFLFTLVKEMRVQS